MYGHFHGHTPLNMAPYLRCIGTWYFQRPCLAMLGHAIDFQLQRSDMPWNVEEIDPLVNETSSQGHCFD